MWKTLKKPQKMLELINEQGENYEIKKKSTCKNQLYFYTLTMNNLEMKLRKQFHAPPKKKFHL